MTVFTLFRYLRDQRGERERRDEEQKRWLKNQETELEKRAEERFQAAVIGLGDEKEGAQIGAAILLRTFLRPGYEQFYTQTFDLAVANLRRRGVSKIVQHQLWNAPENPDIALLLTTLDQALIVVFKEAFPLARDQEKREPASLDATGVQLDHAYLVGADLKQMWGPGASLQKVNLFGANLIMANLIMADLSGAALVGACLFGANLSGAYLSGVEGLTKEQRAAYKAQGALVDEEPASNVPQGSVSTSLPLEPESVQPLSPQETTPTPDAGQSNGTSSQVAPDKEPSREAEKGDQSGRTP